MGRGLYGVVQIVVSWCFTLSACCVMIPANILLLGQGYQRLNPWFLRNWGRVMLRISRVRLEVEHEERLWVPGPAIVTLNHASLLDLFIFTSVMPPRGVSIAKKEMLNVPIIGLTMRAFRYVFVDRENSKRARASMAKAARRLVRQGLKVFIAPEGTRSQTDQLGPFKMGAFHLALATRVPIIPVVVHGARELHPYGKWTTLPGVVRVVVHQEVPTDHFTEETLREEADSLRRFYQRELGMEEQP
jgi:1-acyl-sn-glycerol-3-phosphate acyltransferase